MARYDTLSGVPSGTKPKPGALHQRTVARIKALVTERGTTVAALADAAGMSRPQLSNILNGARNATLTLDQFGRIADALGVDPRELM